MYRDLTIRVYDTKAIEKVDWLKLNGIDVTEILTKALMEYQKENKEETKKDLISMHQQVN